MTSKPEETQESNTNTTHPPSSTSWPHGRAYQEKDERLKFWGILVFSVIGATATTYAVGHLRHTIDWIFTQFSRSHSSWKDATNSSFRSNFKEEARRRYNRRMQEEYEEEMERVERIRRMQSVFNRERTKYKKTYESWREYGPGAYHQHFQREDWYWKTDASYKDQRTNSHTTPTNSGNYMLSHHYSVLGLDRWRTKPYTEDEIKTAFRAKAMEFHPDQNQDNKEAAEAKFKEVMTSYEAIKSERKNGKS